MPPQKRHSAARRPTKSATTKAKKRAPPRPKTRALAVVEAVRREPLSRVRPGNPLAALEPLRRTIVERQVALIDLAMTWSPAHIIVSQQAAFWEGFMRDGVKVRPARKTTRKRLKGASRKAH